MDPKQLAHGPQAAGAWTPSSRRMDPEQLLSGTAGAAASCVPSVCANKLTVAVSHASLVSCDEGAARLAASLANALLQPVSRDTLDFLCMALMYGRPTGSCPA
uniref:Uncharacterized protein n=1 Tax=Chlamydomonas euryale TaxID=1486919 RepID=A0A7R9VVX0_9CHLO|mmetsp:Transcript_4996/g.15195  ORF Transcript_4996/g.15195 Transcript_4996/m.15195 type:complete len:103 (+) Transcript_4996:298-606(+)